MGFPHPFRSAGVTLALLLCPVPSNSGPTQPGSPHSGSSIRFERLTIDQGLSQNTVLCIFQDSRGFLWFGTQDGLNRFDGYSFTIFRHDPGDSASLPHNYIQSIAEDLSGRLWIATDGGGLACFDRNRERFLRFVHSPGDPGSISSDYVLSMLVDREGTLWIGTREGLDRLSPHELDRGRMPLSEFMRHPGGREIRALLEDRDGKLWVGSDGGGVAAFDRSTRTFGPSYRHGPGRRTLSSDRVRHLYEDESGGIWISTWGGGVNLFDRRLGEFDRFVPSGSNPRSISSDAAMAVFESRSLAGAAAKLWVGTLGGLNSFESATGTFERIPADPARPGSLSADAVICGYQDRSGALWIGTLGGGLNRADRVEERFTHIANDPGTPGTIGNNNVWAIHTDRDGALWIGTDGGLARRDPRTGRFTHLRHSAGNPRSIANDNVHAICEDRDGYLWIGTWGGGVDRLDKRTLEFVHFLGPEGGGRTFPADRIRAIREDRRGTIWVGSVTGLFSGGPARNDFRRHTGGRDGPGGPDSAGSLGGEFITSLFEDRSGTLWAGTRGGTVNRYDNATGGFERYLLYYGDSALSRRYRIQAIFEDRQGTIWAGGAGLHKLDAATGRFTHYRTADGLPSDGVYGILEDTEGRLWISTNGGLSRFDPRTGVFRNFDAADGLQSNEFNEGAYHQGPGGEMYFGGINGYNVFRPADIADAGVSSPVRFTSFSIFNRPAGLDTAIGEIGTIHLRHDEKVISFGFSLLSFVTPRKNSYAYRLAGFDTGWVNAGTRHEATYTNLDPGRYAFEVKAANGDGVWNATPASVILIIHPPFWRTWWFLSLAAIGAAAAVYGVHRYRLRQILAIERLRVRIASDLHDDLATNLSSIGMFGEILQSSRGSDPAAERKLLERITRLARESTGSVREIMRALDPQSETLRDLFVRFRTSSAENCAAAGVNLTFDAPPADGLLSRQVSSEVRRDINLFMKEAVTNALKHSRCTRVSIVIVPNGSTLSIEIADDGRGFDAAARTEGRGMGTMRMRADSLGGRLEVASKPGAGTSVRLVLTSPDGFK